MCEENLEQYDAKYWDCQKRIDALENEQLSIIGDFVTALTAYLKDTDALKMLEWRISFHGSIVRLTSTSWLHDIVPALSYSGYLPALRGVYPGVTIEFRDTGYIHMHIKRTIYSTFIVGWDIINRELLDAQIDNI